MQVSAKKRLSDLRKFFVLTFISLICTHCSVATFSTPVSDPGIKKPELPFVLSVAQELNDGKHLYVRASIEALTTWSTAEAAIHVSGYRDGQKVAEQTVLLSTLGPVLNAGEKKEIPVVLNAPNLSDYQMELVWGHEHLTALGGSALESKNDAALQKLQLRNLVITSERTNCKTKNSNCDLKYSLSAFLYNNGDTEINNVTLGTGFVWLEGADRDSTDQIPENESKVELAGLQLSPGASRVVHIDLDRTVPERGDGIFKPMLRVVSVDAPTVAPEISPLAPAAGDTASEGQAP